MSAADHDLTPAQWTSLTVEWGGCAYCGQPDEAPQKDCILPISRGGRYTVDNVVPACRSCNASKCNSEVTQWMRRKKLDEHRFLVRQFQITRAIADAAGESDQAPS
ncbi:HNH endonuclease signature motif containing protein [Gordonia caeni]|uniref:HNH endonuclease signature motif containing protein n=2 Tax=Gordonia caeni TaxID=1007097 RepID=A0ABP7P126_9ACTN